MGSGRYCWLHYWREGVPILSLWSGSSLCEKNKPNQLLQGAMSHRIGHDVFNVRLVCKASTHCFSFHLELGSIWSVVVDAKRSNLIPTLLTSGSRLWIAGYHVDGRSATCYQQAWPFHIIPWVPDSIIPVLLLPVPSPLPLTLGAIPEGAHRLAEKPARGLLVLCP